MGRLVGHGASRFGLLAGDVYPREIARLIDHTLLKPDATRSQIETLCAEARQHGFATVCINPAWVRLCSELLRGCETGVCTVVGFPLGATTPDVKAYETARVLEDGAAEVDMVINVGALKSGDLRLVERDVTGVAQACRAAGAVSKVIIETALLTDDEKVRACVIARVAGADFVKTSTGFASGGATAADVALMRRVVGPEMGVKAAGGVRDLKSAQAMIDAGADRIGASVGVKIVQESRGQAPAAGEASKGY
ncbi:MAG: deoxyribose-phosphate aldolase [Vicinamibacteria bacterium]